MNLVGKDAKNTSIVNLQFIYFLYSVCMYMNRFYFFLFLPEKVDIQVQSSEKNEPRRLEVRSLESSRCESKSPSVSPKRQPALKTCQLTTQTDHPAMIRKSSRGVSVIKFLKSYIFYLHV